MQRRAPRPHRVCGIAQHRRQFVDPDSGGEQRQQAWAVERQRLGSVLDEETMGELPDVVDDATIERFRLAAMDGKQRAEQEWKAKDHGLNVAKFGYQQQNDAAIVLIGRTVAA